MNKKPKKAEDDSSGLKHIRQLKTIEGIVATANTLIKFGCLALIFLFSYWMVDSLAGKETLANVNLSLFDSRILGVIFGAGGIVYGISERKLRQRTVKKFQPRIQQLEQRIDPSRSSSLLTASGETHPDDE